MEVFLFGYSNGQARGRVDASSKALTLCPIESLSPLVPKELAFERGLP